MSARLTTSFPRQLRSLHTSIRHLAPRPSPSSSRPAPPMSRPGPPPLPKKEQEEFEALVKAATGGGMSLADARAQAVASTSGKPEEVSGEHRDLRKQPKPEFEGEINPRTGEVGGPKRDPFLAGEGDWQYSGRVTDF